MHIQTSEEQNNIKKKLDSSISPRFLNATHNLESFKISKPGLSTNIGWKIENYNKLHLQTISTLAI